MVFSLKNKRSLPPSLLKGVGVLILMGITGPLPNAYTQDQSLRSLLRKKSFSQAGTTLAQLPQLSASDLQILISLSPKDFSQLYKGFIHSHSKKGSQPPSPSNRRLQALLTGLWQKANHQTKEAFHTLSPLFGFRPWMVRLAGPLGSMAIELSRRGNASGLPILRKIAQIWKGQAFASANLALAFRLLGNYSQADRLYRQAAKESGRAPWVLNNWGLCRDAMGDLEGSLRLFFEGARRAEENKGQKAPGDAATCQTNAAYLLEKRARDGDIERAIALLERAVHLAPDRIRPRYYLHIFRIKRTGGEQ